MFNHGPLSASSTHSSENAGNQAASLLAALENLGVSSDPSGSQSYAFGGSQQSTGTQFASPFGQAYTMESPQPAQIAQPPPQLAIRTIFVTGFPADVKERELHNLLKFLPGFEASQMHMKGATSQGFALFSAPEHARFALETITQWPFDESLHLRCEMAHKNLFVKDGDSSIRQALPLPGNHKLVLLPGHPVSSTNPNASFNSGMIGNTVSSHPPSTQPSLVSQQLSGQVSQTAPHPSTIVQASVTGSGSGTTSTYVRSNRPASLPPTNQSSFSTNQLAGLIGALNNMAGPGNASLQQLGLDSSVYSSAAQNVSLPVSALGFAPVSNKGDKPPCNTLFVGNLSSTVDEEEIATLFGSQPGFKQIKVVKGAKQVTCFVEFEDVASASAVHTSLQGAVLASSDRGGIRVQYSKNSFGRRDSPLNILPPQMGNLGGGALGGLLHMNAGMNSHALGSGGLSTQPSLDQRWSHPVQVQGQLASQMNPGLLRSLNSLNMSSNDPLGGLPSPWADGGGDMGLMQGGNNHFQFMNSMSVNPGQFQLPAQAGAGSGLGLQGLSMGDGSSIHNAFMEGGHNGGMGNNVFW